MRSWLALLLTGLVLLAGCTQSGSESGASSSGDNAYAAGSHYADSASSAVSEGSPSSSSSASASTPSYPDSESAAPASAPSTSNLSSQPLSALPSHLPNLTRAQVAAHAAASDCWVIFNGSVYNLTRLTSRASDSNLSSLCGTEVSSLALGGPAAAEGDSALGALNTSRSDRPGPGGPSGFGNGTQPSGGPGGNGSMGMGGSPPSDGSSGPGRTNASGPGGPMDNGTALNDPDDSNRTGGSQPNGSGLITLLIGRLVA